MRGLGLGIAAASIVWTMPAQAAPTQRYDIAAQDLESALDAFAAVSGKEVLAPSDILSGKRSGSVHGDYGPEDALTRLLTGTGLVFEVVDGAYVVGEPSAPASVPTDSGTAIVVTGTRIRGAPVASPRITLTSDEMKDQGLATLTDAARTIPQNFGGGQNPNVGINVPAASGVNVGSGSSFNLRGLGSDATLTLLNGRRLSYSGSRQSVDLSSIPAGIVDRIEIVADGASAIYGSDAVAGVANIVLRRDAEGLVTTVRRGAATDGGGEERSFGATAGARWNGGGGILSYEYGFNAPIVGYQRGYTASGAARGLDLLPEIERHNAAASLHHGIGRLSLSFDGLYNRRRSLTVYAANPAGDRGGLRMEASSRNTSFLVAPSLEVDLGRGWRTGLSASYAEDTGRYATYQFIGDTLVSPFDGCYCNTFWSAELGADGPLFDLPGGPARLAVGAGFRDVGFVSFRGENSPQNIDEHQRSEYAFGEASLPVLARRDGEALLQANGAVRYERYPDLADVVTPKFGLIASPSPDFDIKASWGRSFRAPTMLQRYQSKLAILIGAAALGGTGLPAGSTALLVTGGRANLKPEKARSWSVTLDLHPRALEGARVELGYFNTRYVDRIVTPIVYTSQSLSNPIYADQVIFDPGAANAAQAAAEADQFFNATGMAFDPARVAAIVDNANVNAAIQHIEGVDAAFTLERLLGNGSRVHGAVSASYLDSRQRLTAAQPETHLAGQLFNPPHFRARGVLGWSTSLLSLTGAVNRIGGVTDARQPVPVEIRGMTTVDFTVRLQSSAKTGFAKGLAASLTVQNLFDAEPDRIATSLVYENPYDSTNYSPVGRFIALSVSKSW